MRTFTKPSSRKLVTRFDNELKNLLMEDLKTFMAHGKFINSNIQAPVQPALSAA